jgi:hypothetical protein
MKAHSPPAPTVHPACVFLALAFAVTAANGAAGGNAADAVTLALLST